MSSFRTSTVIPVAGLVAASLCLEGARTSTNKKTDPAETPQAITATILHLEDLLDEAESQHRVADVDRLIADDYRGITVGGGIIVKRDVLAAVGGTEQTSSQSSQREVRVLENAAVYTALVLDRGTDEKTQQPYLLATRVLDVWQKRGREWKLVNDQATAVTLDRLAQ
ncbi:MAG: nuclear transport factor 2 family protein [Bryobacterales bacterium]|nr:nuclear transport factor 2 family protein [Bryobacterales bacterium]MBV9398175.1 nuclear transport factor 2 family protein [Bryobacterales bacterium]